MFKKKKKTSGKIDNLVTKLIIGSAIASIIGLSQTKKGKSITKEIKNKGWTFFSKTTNFFGKITLKVLDLFDKIKK